MQYLLFSDHHPFAIIETILRRIQSSIDLSEEEKKNLEASLRGQDNEDEDK